MSGHCWQNLLTLLSNNQIFTSASLAKWSNNTESVTGAGISGVSSVDKNYN